MKNIPNLVYKHSLKHLTAAQQAENHEKDFHTVFKPL